jgi:predicted GH43/DUF377 family glycosyl hydrolase
MILRMLLTAAVVMTWSVTAAAQTEWVLYEGNPVVPGFAADEWPGNMRFLDAVVVVDGTYHMYFTGTAVDFGVNHEIGHATSPDGINWTMDPQNPVMTPEDEGDWEVTSYCSLDVLHDGNEFQMWYGGCQSGAGCRVGMATSPDGSTWTRYSENPVFGPGPVGSFDYGGVSTSAVLRRGGRYQMWYTAASTYDQYGTGSIGYATSSDGVTWVRHPSAVLEPGPGVWDGLLVYGPAVLFDGASYHMWYTGIWGYGATWLGVQIGYATSPDGISWTKDPANPMDILGDYAEQACVLLHPHRHECEMFYGNPTNYEFVINRATSSCRAFAQVRRSSGRRLHSK